MQTFLLQLFRATSRFRCAASRCGFSPYEIPEKNAHSCKHDSCPFLEFRMALNSYHYTEKRRLPQQSPFFSLKLCVSCDQFFFRKSPAQILSLLSLAAQAEFFFVSLNKIYATANFCRVLLNAGLSPQQCTVRSRFRSMLRMPRMDFASIITRL